MQQIFTYKRFFRSFHLPRYLWFKGFHVLISLKFINQYNFMSKVDESVEAYETQFNQLQTIPETSTPEGMQQLLLKYHSRNKELAKALHAQKKNNEHLKDELRNLNETLTHLVVKIQPQKTKIDNTAKKEQVAKKELENEMKKNALLRKENDNLKARMRVFEAQNLQQLQNEIRQKEKVIEDLHSSLKLHEKIGKVEMNQDIYKKQQQAQLKIKNLSQQILHLKKKNMEQKKFQQQQQKSIKFHHQQAQNTEQAKSKSLTKNSDVPKQTYALLQQQNTELKERLQASQNTRKSLQKTLKAETQIFKNKFRVLQKSLLDAKEQLTRKDKQIAGLVFKLKQFGGHELQKDKKDDTLQTWSTPSIDCRRQIRGIALIRPGAKKFDDNEVLPQDKQYRISKITFKYFEQHIVSLTTEYSIEGGSKQAIQTYNTGAQYQSLKQATLQLADYQYIKQWEIYSGRWIQFIKLRTSKEQVLQLGNERNTLKCKKHVFEIHNYEKPVSIFGLLQKRNVGDRERQVLVSLGIVLKKKQVLNFRSKSVSKLEIKRNSLILNDKNHD